MRLTHRPPPEDLSCTERQLGDLADVVHRGFARRLHTAYRDETPDRISDQLIRLETREQRLGEDPFG